MSGIRWMFEVYGQESVTRHGVAWGDGIGGHQVQTQSYESLAQETAWQPPKGEVRLFAHGPDQKLTEEQTKRVQDAILALEAGTIKGQSANEVYCELLREVPPENRGGWKPLTL